MVDMRTPATGVEADQYLQLLGTMTCEAAHTLKLIARDRRSRRAACNSSKPRCSRCRGISELKCPCHLRSRFHTLAPRQNTMNVRENCGGPRIFMLWQPRPYWRCYRVSMCVRMTTAPQTMIPFVQREVECGNLTGLAVSGPEVSVPKLESGAV